MITARQDSQRGFAVWWSDLERWIIPVERLFRKKLPKNWVRIRVGDLVRQISGKVRVEPARQYKMAGVRWYGKGVFHRETVGGEGLSTKWVSPLVPGALIYNRLFAWKESFAVVPSELSDCFVSSEFPQFIPDPTRVLPEFLYLFSILPTTIRQIQAASIGAAAISRNRFSEDKFLSLEMALPPLDEQKKIVAHWQEAQLEIASARQRASQRLVELDARFIRDLGLELPELRPARKAFAVEWPEFHRWGVDFNFLNRGGVSLVKGTYPVVSFRDILEFVQYGTSAKANTSGKGVPVLRIGNIKDRSLDFSELKYISMSAAALKGLLLRDGDILIIRTSGSRDLVGTCAVFRGSEEYSFASYLIRLRFDRSKVVPEFASWYINSSLGRLQVDAISRHIMQNNINSEELRSLRLPLPPVPVQEQIMNRVAAGRAEIAREIDGAARRTKDSAAEVEAMILGVKSPEVN